MKKTALEIKAIARIASCVKISANDYSVMDLKAIATVAKGRIVIANANILSSLDLKAIAACGDVELDFA